MLLLQKSSAKQSSRRQINIEAIHDGILQLPGREYRLILQVSPINFQLKSEDEQDSIIDTFQSFLNSLSIGLQILVRVREIDMDGYVHDMQERLQDEQNENYRKQIERYASFVTTLVAKNKILTRLFYVVVPFHAQAEMDFEFIKEQLYLNCDIVGKGLARLGMQTYSLSSFEVLGLFYSYYNPLQAKRQPFGPEVFESFYTSVKQAEART